MAKYVAKTTENNSSVASFVATVEDPQRRQDCEGIIELMQQASGFEPKMWGTAIIGFGSYHYRYESGHEGDAPMVGFSPRKNEFALYIANFDGKDALLEKLGKYKTAKSCVYIKKLSDADPAILKKLAAGSIKHHKQMNK